MTRSRLEKAVRLVAVEGELVEMWQDVVLPVDADHLVEQSLEFSRRKRSAKASDTARDDQSRRCQCFSFITVFRVGSIRHYICETKAISRSAARIVPRLRKIRFRILLSAHTRGSTRSDRARIAPASWSSDASGDRRGTRPDPSLRSAKARTSGDPSSNLYKSFCPCLGT